MSVVARLDVHALVDGRVTLPRRLSCAAFVCLICFSAACSGALADSLIGQVSVIDGDTIEIHGTRIRLWGIDAPESNQLCRDEDSLLYRCGALAANDLYTFIAKRVVTCVPVNLDRYHRTVASCSIDGTDIAGWLVLNGLALDWPTYSKGKYADAQKDAELHKAGIWAGSYAKPWNFRACLRNGGRLAECSDEISE
jgi:endonuclease YncB( thermonuclease family)